MTEVGNLGADLGQAQKSGSIQPVNWMPSLPLFIIGFPNDNSDKQTIKQIYIDSHPLMYIYV
jgi:hypothetical protein